MWAILTFESHLGSAVFLLLSKLCSLARFSFFSNVVMWLVSTQPYFILNTTSSFYPSFSFSSVCWHGEQAEHAVGPGTAVPHPKEVLRELWSGDGQPGDHQHRPEQGPHLPQSKDQKGPWCNATHVYRVRTQLLGSHSCSLLQLRWWWGDVSQKLNAHPATQPEMITESQVWETMPHTPQPIVSQ